MTAYELMITTNKHLIRGNMLTSEQQARVSANLLRARCTPQQRESFYRGVKVSGNSADGHAYLYPYYFIPPYNEGRKYPTLLTFTPKTHILSANSYELEIIRLLHLFAPDDDVVSTMVSGTLERLKHACFGNHGCVIGECFESLLMTIRFLVNVAPDKAAWIQKQMAVYNAHKGDKHRHWGLEWYYWLCLSEMPEQLALPEIRRLRDVLVGQLSRSCVMNSTHDKETHPMCLHIVRNCLVRLPEYEYIRGRQPYVNPKDNRLYFDHAPASQVTMI